MNDEAFSVWQPRYDSVVVLLVTDNLIKNLREVNCIHRIGRIMRVSMDVYIRYKYNV